MSPTFSEIEEQAKSLPPEERARLAESLLESLQPERSPEVEAAWEQEIQRRVAAYRSGEEQVIDGETVLAELRLPAGADYKPEWCYDKD
jgi:putative addiction module component (TIGR02574 family)